jgi:hypothetical protein
MEECMKIDKVLIWILLLGAFLGVTACDEQEIRYTGSDYVRFTDTSLVYKESIGKVIPIRVHLVGKASDLPITVTYAVSGTAVEGRDYTIEGTKGTVTIPAGGYFGEINLRLINNSNNLLRSSEILFTLNGAAQGEKQVQIGSGKNFTLGNSIRVVIDDDCLFGGFYDASRAGVSRVVKDVAITSTNCTEYLLANWNVGVLNFNADKLTLRFTDNGDNSLTIPSQYNGFLGDTLTGNGAWDPRSRQIVLNITIKTTGSTGADTLIAIPQITYVPRQ